MFVQKLRQIFIFFKEKYTFSHRVSFFLAPKHKHSWLQFDPPQLDHSFLVIHLSDYYIMRVVLCEWVEEAVDAHENIGLYVTFLEQRDKGGVFWLEEVGVDDADWQCGCFG